MRARPRPVAGFSFLRCPLLRRSPEWREVVGAYLSHFGRPRHFPLFVTRGDLVQFSDVPGANPLAGDRAAVAEGIEQKRHTARIYGNGCREQRLSADSAIWPIHGAPLPRYGARMDDFVLRYEEACEEAGVEPLPLAQLAALTLALLWRESKVSPPCDKRGEAEPGP